MTPKLTLELSRVGDEYHLKVSLQIGEADLVLLGSAEEAQEYIEEFLRQREE